MQSNYKPILLTSMTLNNKIISNKIRDINSLWKGKSLYHLYKKGSTPWKWHKKIFDYAKNIN